MPRFLRLTLIAALLAGCSSPGSIAAPNSTDQPPSELAFSDAAALADGVLELTLVRAESLLPLEVSLADQSAVIVADLMYDGLVEADGNSLVPALASSWSANDDFTVWSFTVDTDLAAIPTVVQSLENSLLGDSSRPMPVGQVTGVEATEDGVQITLDSSNAGFAWLLSGLHHSIALPNDLPTGGYDVAADTFDETSLLAMDPSEPDVLVTWVENYQETYESLVAGSADGAVVGAADLGQASSDAGQAIVTRSISRFYVANIASPVMRDTATRAAVVRAIDRESLVSFAPAGSFVSEGLVPTTLAGFAPGSCGSSCDRDATLASDLVATGIEVPPIRVGYVSVVQAIAAQSIVSDLKIVGISAEAIEYDAAGLAEAIDSGEVDLYSFGLVSEAGSVDAVIPMLHSSSALNPARLADETIDQLIEEALTTADDAARWALLEEAHQVALSYSMFAPVTSAQSELVWLASAGELFLDADGSVDTQSPS